MTRYRGWGIVLVLLFAAAACGSGGPAAGETSGTTSAVSTDATPSSEPPLPTEGSGTETPQTPVDKVYVKVTAPLDGQTAPGFSADSPTACVDFFTSDALDEDVTVAGLSIGPGDAFVRDDGPCEGGDRCEGFVYPAHEQTGCSLGVRWNPDSGVEDGEATIRLTALCRSRRDDLCDGLDDAPPSRGTRVEAFGTRSLHADLRPPDEEVTPSASSPSQDEPTDGSTDEPTDGSTDVTTLSTAG